MEAKDQDGPGPGGQWISSSTTSEQKRGFQAYTQHQLLQRASSFNARHPRRLIVNRPIVVKLTKEILETYQGCNPTYTFSEALNPKRYLTTPSVPVFNGGLDNEKSDLILAVNGLLANDRTNHRYIIKDLLGQGTFGQVAKCWSEESNCFVAVKIIKNQPAYHQQAVVEVSILDMLNKFDPDDKNQIVRMIDHFYYQDHLCIVFEMLGLNLFELLKANGFKGFSLNLIRTFTKQILKALALLREACIIHCDLKPENILLTTSPVSAEIKLIDFGSACREDRTVYSYIQSRFYRSPEVVLGHSYTTAIDMWSLGCVAAELFLGLPLFPAQSQYDLLQRLIKVLGGKPPDHILRHAKNTSKYFKIARAPIEESFLSRDTQHSQYHFLTPDEIRTKENEAPVIGKHYFHEDWDLENLILRYPMRKGMSEDEVEKESWKRLVFVDFLKGLVNLDPLMRWTPWQAEQHPFITDAPFTGPFHPRSDPPRLPIYQAMNMDHNPVSGHWFGAGLSPRMSSNHPVQFGSPHHLGLSSSYNSSYYGSFIGDAGAGAASSWGSNNGETLDGHMNHHTPPNAGLGVSPDVRRRKGTKPSNAFGFAHVGMSPSGGSFLPTSLGASPSNLASPGSHFQPSPGSPSVGSSSRFGPTSPARTGGGGGGGAASLGKAAAFKQYSKRRGWGSPGSMVNTHNENRSLALEISFTPPHNSYDRTLARNELSLSSRTDNVGQSTYLQSPRSPSYYTSQYKSKSGEVAGTSSFHGQSYHTTSFQVGSLGDPMQKKGEILNREEDIPPLPNPGDWDPHYSEDQLIEEGDVGTSSGVSSLSNQLEVIGLNTMQSSGFVDNSSLPAGSNVGQPSMQPHNGQMVAAYRPSTAGLIYMDGGSPTTRAHEWNPLRPPYHNHQPQQISQSRLGQHFVHVEQPQQGNPYPSPNVRLSEQLTIPFSLTHPDLGRQFLARSIQASAGYSVPYITSGNPAPPQGMHIPNQMNPIGPPHWASGFPGQRYAPFNRAFHPRRDGRTDV